MFSHLREAATDPEFSLEQTGDRNPILGIFPLLRTVFLLLFKSIFSLMKLAVVIGLIYWFSYRNISQEISWFSFRNWSMSYGRINPNSSQSYGQISPDLFRLPNLLLPPHLVLRLHLRLLLKKVRPLHLL